MSAAMREATLRQVALRQLLTSGDTTYIVEAHNALSALIVEEAGCPGIWASSLTLSAASGMRDNNELSMSQVLDTLETMTDRTRIPILFDGDTGYGNFSHFQRLVRKLSDRKVAGVCIEDKVFPKTNSFIRGEMQELASIDEFCGKLRAGRDAVCDDFVIVARTEALITGLGMNEALERAASYADAGADAILIHSKESSFDQVAAFLHRWKGHKPVICVPTTYSTTPWEQFQNAGIAMVIWANHILRAAVTAMQKAACDIARDRAVRAFEPHIAPVKEIFRLQNTSALARDEERYLGGQTRGIVLASDTSPKSSGARAALHPIGDETVIARMVRTLRSEGIRDIAIASDSHHAEFSRLNEIKHVEVQPEHRGALAALVAARSHLKGDVLVSHSDIVFKPSVVRELLMSSAPVTLVAECVRQGMGAELTRPEYRLAASGYPMSVYDEREFKLHTMGDHLRPDETDGQWIGLAYARREGTRAMVEALDALGAIEMGKPHGLAQLWMLLVRQGISVRVLYMNNDWIFAERMPA